MLSKTDLSERISRLSPEKRALFEKRLKGEVTEKSEVKIIPPPSSEVSIPLSFSQERLWFLYKFEPDSAVYNRPLVLHFTGDLNISTLEKSLNIIIQRHEILRTIFPDHDGVPCQVVLPEEYISLPVFDVSKSKVRHIITEKSREIINLEEGPPLIPHLLRITEKEHILLLTMHHIVFDGWSEGVFLNEVTEIYRSLSAGKEPSLNPLSIQYADFAIWQREWLKGETLKKQLSYWQKKLEDIVPLELPFDHPRQPVQSSKGRRQTFMLTESLSHSLKELSSNEGVTLFITLLTSFNILLYRYTGQEDIATGTPVANRNRKEFEGLIGFFVNTLVLRSNLSKNPSFREFLGRVREVAMEAFEHQQLPFEKLVEELNPERILSRTPLFQVMFHLRNVPKKCLLLPDLKIKEFDLDTVMTKFDLTLEIEEKPEGLSCLLEYNTDLFEDRTITRMKGHFQTLLEGIVKNPDEKLSNLPILSDEEKNQLLVEWNNTLIDYPKDRCIHQLFEEQVEKTPHNIAVVFKDRKLTYRELNEKSNQMAGILRQAGVISESVLAIMVEPSIEMVIGIMAILKAGGAYVPIDPSYPVERIKYILQDTESSILLTQKHLSSKIDFKGLILFLDDENLYSGDVSNLPLINKPSHLAYIIYTSATTGKPKGVMIEHSSLSNLCFWYKYACNLNERDRSALFMSYTFDPSIKEIFSCLLAGGSLYIISKDIRLSIYRLNEYFENNNITVTNLPTQLCEEFMDIVDNKSLRLLNTGGEKLKKFKKKSYEIGNNYGPTENTVDTTRFIVDKNYDNIPIGKPIYNNRVYILDTFNNLQPVGVPGELCIGGSGLARGYLNAPDITEEKFVKNPFESGARMYKTGDLARWLPDGNIELLGRIDNQIKLRGFRIEPEEIEKVILQQDTIRAAIVVDYDDSGGQKYLCAYIISDKEINIRNLKLELSKELPDYMIPLYIIQIDKIPLTINGKVDRKALPVPDFIDRTVNYIPPETEIQKKLSDIWSEILNIHKPGIDDNFFNLGGHSLKTVIMTAKIKKIFNVEIPVKEIFRFPTIRQIARLIGRAEENIYPPFDITQKREYYPLSSQQKRLFALEQFEEMGTTYNVPISLIIEGKLDIERLYKGLEILIERHESLRTSFDIVNEEAVQKIHKNIKPEKNYIESSESNIENIIREFIKPFNFKKAPLFRYELVKLAEEKHLLLIDIHHIVIDELSINIILKELFQFYEGKELPEIRYQYKDFAVWQDKLLKSDLIKPQEEFWINKFSGEIPLLKLPIDYSRPIIQDFCGDTVLFSVESTLTEKLKSLASNTGTTLSMVLMAAFNILLSKYSSQEDIIIGTTLGGRRIEEVQYITGMFVNTLPIRNFPASHKTFMEFLNEVKENLLEVYDNEDYQLELLINKLNIKRDTGKNPLFDVLFVSLDMDISEFSMEKMKIRKHYYHKKTAKFDITLFARSGKEEIEFRLEYGTGLFKPHTINRMIAHFRNILRKVIENPTQKLKDIEMLSEEEKHILLYDFNRTEVNYPSNKIILEFFHEQVKKTPNKIAVVYKDKSLSYRELNEKSSQLGRLLRNAGVTAGTIAGIMVEPSLEMVTGVMAILKSGGAFIPLDPAYPPERINFILRNCNCRILLSQKHLMEILDFFGNFIDLEDEKNYEGESLNFPIINIPADLAYIIYTSGSTGEPKGVMVSHKSFTHFCLWYKDLRKLNERDNTTKFVSSGFDVTVWEIFPTLISGATLHIISDDIRLSPYKLNEYYEKNNITVSFLPTQFGEQFMELTDNKSLRFLDVAGEKLRIFRKRNYTLINGYGPVEYADCITYFIVDKDYDNIPIGKPVWNTKVYILDRFNKLQPIGIPGELCVSGPGVSMGYVNNPEKTGEVFVENPFIPGERMYKTGDLARWLSDGNIEFLGRIDKQVKLRGFRIEPAEIEQNMLKQDGIRDAAVIDYDDKDGNKYLCGYIVSDKEINIRNLKSDLSKSLPDYMIPSYISQIKEIPLTPNGKIDRKALPLPEFKDMSAEYVPPQDDIERKIAEIWEDVLGISPIGIRDNFFDSGGNSILAVRLFAYIHKIFNRDLSPSILLKGATIKYLAGILKEKEPVKESKFLVPVQPEGKRPPFYCVVPVGDEILFLSSLSGYLGNDQPFYGLQVKKEEFLSVESLAECYIKEIQNLQPEGPYFLGGFSTGVPVVFEMAQQLYRKGYKIGCLVIFDRGIKMSWNLRRIFNLIAYLPYWLRDFSTRPKEKITLIFGTVNMWKEKFKRKIFSTNNIKDQIYVEKILNSYSYESYEGSIILFRSQKHLLIVPYCYDPHLGWGKIIKGEIEVKVIPHASHTGMFKEPYVRILSEELKKCLDKSQNKYKSTGFITL